MSYTVLARKWRPRTFNELSGQEHVRRALTNALDADRLHHAFLFTGTRGVGKTTIARILAKCLNCEKGISSEPCGECANCREIDEGRFVDLIEVDAASRTKVDDTRELLDNVQYRPSRGTCKVYLIDEVHMLSKHSFNALLKTLEEPPEHVKFLLATTDPQKLPVTVLSRCLQFNLKKLPVDIIMARLAEICKSEQITADEAGLLRLARAAAGSMRDGLSLLDQAIAFGAGSVTDDDVRAMLGSIDRHDIARLLEAIVDDDAEAVMRLVADMDQHAPDYDMALLELAALVQRAALAQAAPGAIDDSRGDRELVMRLAGATDAELLQLLYQIALIGRRDLHLAADSRGGFEMVLLRMLAFRPAQPGETVPRPSASNKKRPAAGRAPEKKADTRGRKADRSQRRATATQPEWSATLQQLQLRGAARELAANCELDRVDGRVWHLLLEQRHAHLLTENLRLRLRDALRKLVGEDADVRIREGHPSGNTPASLQQKDQQDRVQQARQALDQDPNVKALKKQFGATIVDDTVRPTGTDTNQDLFEAGKS